MSNKHEKINVVILVLMVTIIIDIMGLGLVFPIIPELTLDNTNTLFLSVDTSEFIRNFFYGLIMAVWPLGLFIGSSIIGRLSDIYGRKRLLIISLIGIASSYILSVLAIYVSSIYIFILSRFTVGLFGGCFGLAQTIIVDISPKERLTRNLSFVTLAASIGMILGPLLTTIVGKIFQQSILAVMLPCLIGGIITLINLASVCIFLKETNTNRLSSKFPNIIDTLFSFRKMFFDKRIVILAVSFLLMQAAWGFYIESFPLVMSTEFNLTQSQIGLSFVCAALGYLLGILVVLPKLEKALSLKSIIIYNGVLLAVLLVISAVYPNVILEYIAFAVGSLLQLLFYSAILTWISNSVDASEQGQVMGGTVSIFGIAWAVNALLISFLVTIGTMVPIYLAALLFLVSAVVVLPIVVNNISK